MPPLNPESTGPISWRQTLRWSLPFLAVFLPIVFVSEYAFRLNQNAIEEFVTTEQFAATNNLAQLLSKDVRDALDLVRAVASVPGTVQAVQNRDNFAIKARLKAVTISYPEIDRVLIAYPDGALWGEHPASGLPVGLDLSYTPWYQSVSTQWKSVVTGIYPRRARHNPAIAFASPIKDADENVLAVLVFEYSVSQLLRWSNTMSLSSEGQLILLDHRAAVVAHPNRETVLSDVFSRIPAVQDALAGQTQTTEFIDPVLDSTVVATLQPVAVGSNTWLVIAAQPTATAYAQLYRLIYSFGVVAVIMILFTLGLVVMMARIDARNRRLNVELSRTNQRLRELASIVHYSNDAIIGLTLEGIVTSWNESATALYGYSREEMIGQPFEKLIPEDSLDKWLKILADISEGTEEEELETARRTKAGEVRPVSSSVSAIDDGDETLVAFSLVERDITERKEIEKMRSDFISFVSHQLKAPITAIRWLTEEILDGDFGEISEELREIILQIEDVNSNNYQLIMDILNVSRIQRGVIAVELEPTGLKDIADLALKNYRKAIEKAGLELIEEGFDQEITVLAEADKMAESVTNAISNAIKHTPSGGITVSMGVEGKRGFIAVTDTGEGMPPETVAKLFTRNEVLGAKASAESSSGLGLYIAKKFMELQGGEVTVSSEVGKGSTFTYWIPLA